MATVSTAVAKPKTSSQSQESNGKEDEPPKKKVPPFYITNPTRSRFLNMLTYGEYGVGKTFMCATAVAVPFMRDVILIDAEAGDLTLAEDHSGFKFTDIDTIRVKDFHALGRVHEYLTLHCRLRDEFLETKSKEIKDRLIDLEWRLKGEEGDPPSEPRLYRTNILDSLSEMESHSMYQLLGIFDETRIDEEVQSAEWADYKRNHTMIQRLVRKFRDLPMNTLIICAQQYVQDEQKKFNYSPALTGKLSDKIQGFVDMVGYLARKNITSEGGEDKTVRRLYVEPVGRFKAKNRFPNFRGTFFDNPTIGDIMNSIGLSDQKT